MEISDGTAENRLHAICNAKVRELDLQVSELRIHLRAMCDEIGDPARFKEAREFALELLSKSEKRVVSGQNCVDCGVLVPKAEKHTHICEKLKR
jgi:hypothetical protein